MNTYSFNKPSYFLFQDSASEVSYACNNNDIMNMKRWIRTRMIIFKQGIGIAEKSQETRMDRWGGNVNLFRLSVIC